MSKFKKRLKRAAKVGLGLAAAYALTKSKMDMGKELISGKDSEVGAIASKARVKDLPKADIVKPKPLTTLEKRKSFRHGINRKKGVTNKIGLSMEDVRARNKAFDAKLKAKGPVERYSMLKSMGFSEGKMIKAKGGKEIVGKKTKLF